MRASKSVMIIASVLSVLFFSIYYFLFESSLWKPIDKLSLAPKSQQQSAETIEEPSVVDVPMASSLPRREGTVDSQSLFTPVSDEETAAAKPWSEHYLDLLTTDGYEKPKYELVKIRQLALESLRRGELIEFTVIVPEGTVSLIAEEVRPVRGQDVTSVYIRGRVRDFPNSHFGISTFSDGTVTGNIMMPGEAAFIITPTSELDIFISYKIVDSQIID